MKFIVDSLPYNMNNCPFHYMDSWGYTLCPYKDNKTKCPRYWDIHFIYSDYNPHECNYLIEFDKFLKENTPNG